MSKSDPPPPPSKIVCVGRNYALHAREMGGDVPEEPLLFLKPPSAILGSGTPIRIPPDVGRVDFEGEIAVVLGQRARAIAPSEALSVIGGVLPLNDVTARDLQRADSQWTRAKGFDTFCPLGPAVSAEGLDLAALTLVTRVNGDERQRGSTGEMVFPLPYLVAYISRIMTLEPGDIVSTGTPDGVGPLAPGDEVEVEIEGLSSVVNPVVAGTPRESPTAPVTPEATRGGP